MAGYVEFPRVNVIPPENNVAPGPDRVKKCEMINEIAKLVFMYIKVDEVEYRVILIEPLGPRYMRMRVVDRNGQMLKLDLPITYSFNIRMENIYAG